MLSTKFCLSTYNTIDVQFQDQIPTLNIKRGLFEKDGLRERVLWKWYWKTMSHPVGSEVCSLPAQAKRGSVKGLPSAIGNWGPSSIIYSCQAKHPRTQWFKTSTTLLLTCLWVKNVVSAWQIWLISAPHGVGWAISTGAGESKIISATWLKLQLGWDKLLEAGWVGWPSLFMIAVCTCSNAWCLCVGCYLGHLCVPPCGICPSVIYPELLYIALSS